MNLQEILNYRPHCLIHKLPMDSFRAFEDNTNNRNRLQGLSMEKANDGLLLKFAAVSSSEGILFGFNDTCVINGAQEALKRITKKPIVFMAACSKCCKVARSDIDPDRLSVTSLRDVDHSAHFYTFTLSCKLTIKGVFRRATGDYECIPGREIVRYNENDKFYHMIAPIGGGETYFKIGFCNTKSTVDQIINSLSNFKLNYDPIKIQSLGQMVDKIKLYSLFS